MNPVKEVNKYFGYANKFGLTPFKLYQRVSGESYKYPKIFCVSIPKSGTHLIQRLLLMHPPIYRNFMRVLNNTTCKNIYDFKGFLKNVKNGQLVLSHTNFKREYYEYLCDNGFTVLFMIRDPRDILISEAHFVDARNDYPWRDLLLELSINERIEMLIKGSNLFWDIGKRLDDHSGWLKSEKVLTIRFEDLVGTDGGGNADAQKKAIKGVFNHIGTKHTEFNTEKIVDGLFSKKTLTFRKGKINQWKDVYTTELKNTFKSVAGSQLIDYGYENDFDW